ncbi:hypothetical protein PCAR4_930007 [Paraburkholderia caribensis]|nr:hypothetical protein PCAR4_930007 [Paraburkholderia caribensis]
MTSVGADAVLRLLHHPLVQFLLNVKSQRYAFEVERRFRTAAHRKTSRNGCLRTQRGRNIHHTPSAIHMHGR